MFAKLKSLLSQDLSVVRGRVDVRALSLFCRQLSTLLNVGLPLLRALNILADRTSNLVMRAKIRKLAEQVEAGKSFSAALAEEGRIFNDFFVNTVRAGEEGGILQKTLQLMADYMEKDKSIQHRMRSALFYPALTLCMAMLVLGLILALVVPRFEEVYRLMNVSELPAITQIVIDTSTFLRTSYIPILIGLAAFIVFLILFAKSRPGRRFLDWLWLKIPGIGGLQRKILLYRFSRLLHLLLESGVSVQRAIEICAKASGNAQIEKPLMAVADSITKGRSVEASFREHRFFPQLFVDMVGIGEETGAVGSVMSKLSSTYEEEVDNSLNIISMVIEPVMVLVVGSIVVLIAVAIFVPYLSMAEAMKI